MNLKQFVREKEFLLLLLFGLLYFFPPIFLGKTFFYGDLYTYFFGAKKVLASLLKSGEFPVWNPYLHGGQPLFANLNNGVLYPSTLLYRFLPFFTALNLDIALHLILCSLAAYLFSRSIGSKPLASFMTAIIYGYCGYTLSLGNLYNRVLAAPYIPLLLLSWHAFHNQNWRRWFAITVLLACLQFLAGAPEISVISLGLMLLWSLFYPYKERAYPHMLLSWILLVVWLIGICALQVIPTAQLVQQSPRYMIENFEAFTQFSIAPGRLPELLIPGFLGSKVHLSRYWGNALEPTGTPFIWSLYLGVPVLMLAFYGGLVKNGTSHFITRKLRVMLLAICFIAVLLSLGKYLPFYSFLYQIPVLQWFRYPAKFMHAAVLPVALLAGWSLQEFGERAPSRRFILVLTFFASLLILAAAAFSVSTKVSASIERLFFAESNNVITQGITRSVWQSAGISASTALCLLFIRKKKQHLWILVVLITADLFISGIEVNPYLPRSMFLSEPPAATMVKQNLAGGRFYRPESKRAKLIARSDDISNGILWDIQTLNWYSAAYYNIPLMYNASFETLETAEILQLRLLAGTLSWEKRSKLLSAANVGVVLSSQPLQMSQWKEIGTVRSNGISVFYLYSNQTMAPRAGIFDSGAIARSVPQALKLLFHPAFDPRRHVILESPGPHPRPCDQKRAYSLRLLSESASSRSYLAETTCDSYLSTAIPYYKGWKAQIDGKQIPLIRANVAFFAVYLPAGKHVVRFNYFPDSILAGAAISILFALSLPFAALLATGKRK